jgi:sugar O-acyltransferase (sialic acid O-acetyltransferase NeuD family)
VRKVVLFGTGQVASVVYVYLTHDSPFKVAAFTVDRDHVGEKTLFDLSVVPFEEVENIYPPDEYDMFVALGFDDVNHLRAERYHLAKAKGYHLISYISSMATTWPGLVIGENCLILEYNQVQPFVEIGNNVIIWCDNHIGHHVVLHDHCFIASQVAIGGNVTVEPYSFIGMNATVRNNVKIARECVIGAGALILRDTQERGVYVGSNARRIPLTSDRLPKI